MLYPTVDSANVTIDEASTMLGVSLSHTSHPEKLYYVSEVMWQTSTDEYAYLLDDANVGMSISMTRKELLDRLDSGIMAQIQL